MPWTRVDDWYDTLPRLADLGFTTVALTPDDHAESLAELAAWAAALTPPSRLAIVVGSEGPGLTPRWLSTAQTTGADRDGDRGRLAQRGRRRCDRVLRDPGR